MWFVEGPTLIWTKNHKDLPQEIENYFLSQIYPFVHFSSVTDSEWLFCILGTGQEPQFPESAEKYMGCS